MSIRGFRGEADYPLMADVIASGLTADQTEWVLSAEDVARDYSHLENSDPWHDMLFVEADGQVVGYGRVEGTSKTTACACTSTLPTCAPSGATPAQARLA